MRQRSHLLAMLLALCAWGMLHAQTVDLTKQTEPLADLSQVKWRFHPGDDPRWADPSFDDSQWPLLRGDLTWDQQGYKGLSGFAWYRIHVKVPADLPLSFSPGYVFDNFQVFADGKQVAQWGTLSPNAVPLYGESSWALVAPIPPHSSDLVIALRVWHWPVWAPVKSGGLYSYERLLGAPATVARQVDLAKSADLVSQGARLVLALFCLLGGLLILALFAKERSSSEYLWFGVFLLCHGLDFFWLYTVHHWFPQRLDVQNGIDATLYDSGQIALIVFFFRFIGSPVTRWTRRFLIAQVPFILADVFIQWTGFIRIPYWETIVLLDVALGYLILLWLVFSYWKRSGAARRLAVPLVLVTAANVVRVVYENLYLAGISGHTLPPMMTYPFYLSYPDLAQFCFLATMAFVLVERFAETQTERSRLQSEFEAARTVQQVLIPDFLPPVVGLIVESAYLPAQEVGGDFFQVLPIPGGDAFIVVGDVSGKGLKAAMTVSLLVGTLRTLAEYVVSPAEMLAGLNRRLHGRDAGFATCLVLKITPEGEVTIANAGHPNPYLDGVEVSTESDLPLGITLDVTYAETHLHIDPTQSFTLVSDGVVEATAPNTRELFGFDRTQAISRQAANAIAEAARAFGVGAPQADDITVLTVARTPILEAVPV
jgi:sigma-B regulation protein RsbU (phosphoserine phosphatase)